MLPSGQWWDAVRVPRDIGLDALGRLDGLSGAIIEDTAHGHLYWLIPPGDATTWELSAGASVTVLADRAEVAVPGVQRTLGPHWRVPPTRGRVLTDAARLRRALAIVARPAGARRGTGVGQ